MLVPLSKRRNSCLNSDKHRHLVLWYDLTCTKMFSLAEGLSVSLTMRKFSSLLLDTIISWLLLLNRRSYPVRTPLVCDGSLQTIAVHRPCTLEGALGTEIGEGEKKRDVHQKDDRIDRKMGKNYCIICGHMFNGS